MPDVDKLKKILKAAGFKESVNSPSRLGRPARNTQGFRIQVLAVERRAVYIFHVGRGGRSAITQYEKVLAEAGLVVQRERLGLRIETRRVPSDRRAD